METKTIQLKDIPIRPPRYLKNGNLAAQGFQKGSKGNVDAIGTIDLTTRLRNLLLDSLMEKDNSGVEVVVDAIRRCMQNKPEQLLALATRLLPKDVNISDGKTAFAPLVVVNNIQVNNDFNKEKTKETIEGTKILDNKMEDKRTVEAIAFSKPVYVPDSILGSFSKEDFVNARN